MKHFILLTIMLASAVAAQAQYTQQWDLFVDAANITAGGYYRVFQQQSHIPTTRTITIATSDSVTLLIDNININNVRAPISITGGARVCLIVRGVCSVKANSGAGIQLSKQQNPPNDLIPSINITGYTIGSIDDTLKVWGAYGGAGIGTKSSEDDTVRSITISGGAVVATGGNGAAGIGTGDVFADGQNKIGEINIRGGVVIATGGQRGAAIGTGYAYGDGMGGSPINSIQSINISGGTVEAKGGTDGAAIGTGSPLSSGGTPWCIVKKINIMGGMIKAFGDDRSAAIGTGYANIVSGNGSITNRIDNLNISGGNVYAQGARYSAGVGSGYSNNIYSSYNACRNITIAGGVVTAVSSVPHAVDIGGGLNSGTERIIIVGGNVKATHILGDLADDPKDAANIPVFLAKLEHSPQNNTITTNIISLSVDGTDYHIGGNHIDDSTIYVYMPHGSTSDNIHEVRWTYKGSDNQTYASTRNAQWNLTYSIFMFSGQAVTPTTPLMMTVGAIPGFTMNYGEPTIRLTIDTRSNTSPVELVEANPNEVLIKIDNRIVMRRSAGTIQWPLGEWPKPETGFGSVDIFSDPTVNIRDFNAGNHSLVVEYGGTATYKPCSDRQTLNINKVTPPTPDVSGMLLTATYGQALSDVALPVGWEWQKPDTSVGVKGSHNFTAIYCPDARNYNPIPVEVSVRVNKATADCDNAPLNVTVIYGQLLNDTDLGANWKWRYPNAIVNSLENEQQFDIIPDTANFLMSVCKITVLVVPATDAPLLQTAEKHLKVYPNPVFAGGRVMIMLPEGEEAHSVDIFSITGAFIKRYQLAGKQCNDGSPCELPLDILHGIYIIKAGRAAATLVVL